MDKGFGEETAGGGGVSPSGAAPAGTFSQIMFGCDFRARGGGQEMLRGAPIPVGPCSGKVLLEMVVSLFAEKKNNLPFYTRKAAGFGVGPE